MLTLLARGTAGEIEPESHTYGVATERMTTDRGIRKQHQRILEK